MSGVCGANRILRGDIDSVLHDYEETVLKHIKGYKSYTLTGSFVSDLSKNDFGDIDIIVYIDTNVSKKSVKQSMSKMFNNMSDDITIPFTSPKYLGKKSYNSGEIVSVNFNQPNGTVQIDNIIALSEKEMEFKRHFLDLPAEKQGLILGLIKVAVERNYMLLDYRKLPNIRYNEKFEFNLSSSALELRIIEELPYNGTTKFKTKEVFMDTFDWINVSFILSDFDLTQSFEDILKQIKEKVTKEHTLKRIVGVFCSMVSVKSGEVGTPKGDRKEYAIKLVKELL